MATKRSVQSTSMPKIACPNCRAPMNIEHGEKKACGKCGQEYTCYGNTLNTVGVLILSDYQRESAGLQVELVGDYSRTPNTRPTVVRARPNYEYSNGAMHCPSCRSVTKAPDHGETRPCSVCGIPLTVKGNSIWLPVTLTRSEYEIP